MQKGVYPLSQKQNRSEPHHTSKHTHYTSKCYMGTLPTAPLIYYFRVLAVCEGVLFGLAPEHFASVSTGMGEYGRVWG